MILLVDDSEDNRDLYGMFLEYVGFQVELACDGQEALAKIAERAPDLIVMDLAMPRMDGWEATRLIKGNPRTQRIPVLVLTASSVKSDLHRARAAGADQVCTKPCLPEELVAVVRALLAGAGP